MDTREGIDLLTSMLKEKDWFCEVGTDNIGRFVVYVKYMNMETMTSVPDKMLGVQVLVHFIASKTAKREDFTNNANHVPFAKAPEPAPKPVLELVMEPDFMDDLEELPSNLLENDLSVLTDELDRLEKMCGSNALQDIFYEIHDGKNAVTNLSDRYPEVKKGLSKLYDEYGFDVIYEEIPG